jgi:hypothetical protein
MCIIALAPSVSLTFLGKPIFSEIRIAYICSYRRQEIKKYLLYIRVRIIPAVTMKVTIVSDVTLCSLANVSYEPLGQKNVGKVLYTELRQNFLPERR